MSSMMDLIKKLRDEMGAGLAHCKQAIEASGGDYQKAVEWLRKKGVSIAAKKSGRVAAEGLVGVAISSDGLSGAVVEVNSETDFVAKNERFLDLVRSILGATDGASNLEELSSKKVGDETVAELVVSTASTMGEKLSLRRFSKFSVGSGLVESYVHNATSEDKNLGLIGVLLAVESDLADRDALSKFSRSICMHIAAFPPVALDASSVPAAVIDKEKEILRGQAKESGKPDDVIEKMIEGRMRKFFAESVLLEQAYVMDNKKSVSDAIADFEKANSSTYKIKAFEIFKVGEGIEGESE